MFTSTTKKNNTSKFAKGMKQKKTNTNIISRNKDLQGELI